MLNYFDYYDRKYVFNLKYYFKLNNMRYLFFIKMKNLIKILDYYIFPL